MKKFILFLTLLIVHCTLYIENCEAQFWSSLCEGVNGYTYSPKVLSTTIFNNELIVGGVFESAGGVDANSIAKWNGFSWSNLGSGIGVNSNGNVKALTVFNNEIIAGGEFSTAGGIIVNNIAKWNGSNWLALGGGVSGGTVYSHVVYALAVYNNELIAAGLFDTAGGVLVNNIARWNGTSWSPLGSGINAKVLSLTVYNNELIAGGEFTTAGGVSVNKIAKWNGSSWSPLGSGISSSVGQVISMTIFNNDLIVGGWFTGAGGLTVNNIAKWNGANWSTAGYLICEFTTNSVKSLVVYNNELYAGGNFCQVNIAKWNGSNWSAPGGGGNGDVTTLAVFNNYLVAGGYFSSIGGVASVGSIAKWGTGYSIGGYVRYSDNNQPVSNGYVKSFKLDRNTYNLITLDSVGIHPYGKYYLNNNQHDTIYICAFPNSTTQNDWGISYYPSSTFWQNATAVTANGYISNVNVGVTRITSTTASNSVNGKIMRLTNNPLGNLKDAVLYAKNGNSFVRCGLSDGNGIYHLPSLPTGNLKIFVNRLGFNTDSATVNVTSTSNIDSVNFNLSVLPVGINKINDIIPSEYKLYQNYPNPFNPVTNIGYQIAKNSTVSLKVFDLIGKEITTLVNEKQSPGIYEVTFDASNYPSGIYFYTLKTGDFKETKRMILVK
jgi:hypothetical protein